jgi:mRNA interferase MazF
MVVSVNELLSGVDDELIIVVPLSSSLALSPLRPEVSLDEGVDGPSAAICRGVRAIARHRLLRQIGNATPATMAEIETALATILGIER